MKIKKSILLVYHGIKLIFRPDRSIKSLLFLGDEIALSKASKEAVKVLLRDKSLHRMFTYKEGLHKLELDKLKSCGANSFGRDVYDFYTERNLHIYPMKDVENMSAEIYVSERIRKIHDLLHVILGFDTDLIGEAKVNAFVANQLRMPMSFLIICGIILKYFFSQPLQFRALINEIIEGWETGNQFQNFLSVDWDEKLDLPIEEVKRSFSIQKRRLAA